MPANLHLLPPILDYSYPSAQEEDSGYSFTFSLSVVGTEEFTYLYFRATDTTSNAISGLINSKKWLRLESKEKYTSGSDVGAYYVVNGKYVTLTFEKKLKEIFDTNGETHNYKIQVCISNQEDIEGVTMPNEQSSDWSNSALLHINNGIETFVSPPSTVMYENINGDGSKENPYLTELNPEAWYGNYQTSADNTDELVSFYKFLIYKVEDNQETLIEESDELYLDEFSLPYYGHRFRTILSNGLYKVVFYIETNYGYTRATPIYVDLKQPWVPTRDTLKVSSNDDFAYNIINLSGSQVTFMVNGETQLNADYWMRDNTTIELSEQDPSRISATHLKILGESETNPVGTLDLYTPFQLAAGDETTMILAATRIKVFNTKYDTINSEHYLFRLATTLNTLPAGVSRKTIAAYLIKEGAHGDKYSIYVVEFFGANSNIISQEYFIDVDKNFTDEVGLHVDGDGNINKEAFLILKEGKNGSLTLEFATDSQWIENNWDLQ